MSAARLASRDSLDRPVPRSGAWLLIVDGQANAAGHRYAGVAGQALRQRLGHISHRHTAGRERALAGDPAAAQFDSDIAGADPAPNILAGLVNQIAIERFDTTGKAVVAMGSAQHLDAERRRHFAPVIKLSLIHISEPTRPY